MSTLYAVTTTGSTMVRAIRTYGTNTALQQTALFNLPAGFGYVVHVPGSS